MAKSKENLFSVSGASDVLGRAPKSAPVYWDNAQEYNINDNSTCPKLAAGINHPSGERAKPALFYDYTRRR
jgi:hypothetical protein